MSLVIEPYLPHHVAGVRAFNERLLKAGVEFQFPDSPISKPFPPSDGAVLWQDLFVAIDGAIVRGGYILKSESFFAKSGEAKLGNYQLPLSEGIIDKTQALVGVRLLWDAVARNPWLYCLGMGGTERPLPRMLARLGWRVEPVPFYFRVANARRFLRDIRFLRDRKSRAALLDLACFSGAGSLGRAAWDAWSRARRTSQPPGLVAREVKSFGSEVDELFERACPSYSGVADRRSAALALKFPTSDTRFRRLLLEQGGKLKGWALLTCSDLESHKQFGDMRLGCLADNFALPGFESALVRAAYAHLLREGVDLVVSNQSHARWTKALRSEGFLSGPSNFALARSPQFVEASGELTDLHFTRGDGDGPIHL